MQAVKTRNTGPELVVRKLLFRMGYRYRLHDTCLPGSPDIVFPGRRKAVFVHGCFWHGHDCPKGRPPKSRLDYWRPKLEQNINRDRTKLEQIESLGWRGLVVWQCELGDLDALATRSKAFLDEAENPINTAQSSI